MDQSLKKLLVYNHATNQAFHGQLNGLKLGSTDQALSLYNHILAAHHLWNQRILNRELVYDVWPNLVDEAREAIEMENLETSMDILTTRNIESEILYTSTSGKTYRNTISEIFYHIINHSTHHRAQISFMIRQNGETPLPSDLIFHQREEIG